VNLKIIWFDIYVLSGTLLQNLGFGFLGGRNWKRSNQNMGWKNLS